MCGLAAFMGRPSVTTAELCILGAASRGPDAHGWSIPGQVPERRLGRPRGLVAAACAASAGPTLVHARLATVGSASVTNLADAQPLDLDEHRLAHNGVVPPALWAARREECHTGNDSEALLRLILERGILDGLAAVRRFAVVLSTPTGDLYAARSWLPLFCGARDGTWYLCSRSIASWMVPVPERTALCFTRLGAPVEVGQIPEAADDRWETAGRGSAFDWRVHRSR